MSDSSQTRTENRLITRLAHLVFRFTRPMTLGVRAIVLDGEGRVFLVRHSYVPGWHLPGGGVEPGETLEAAMRKELREEGNIEVTGALALHGVFHNAHVSRRDHVAVYVVRDFTQTGPRAADHEIVETGFFALDALPETTTKGTRARLTEALEGRPPAACW
ncbi:MAG TPA: NUDIX domain-containing protein [Beijerinckiaceae bacterium]|nr:NUDIX domain-containing protein [Beijerinckiaceae bacterium]